MNREQLETMTITRLRGLDIDNPEDEELVQEVIEEKSKDEPFLDPNKPEVPSEATDFMTPEKEAAMMAPKEEQVKEQIAEVKKVFCQYCTAVGPIKHKNNCTKPK